MSKPEPRCPCCSSVLEKPLPDLSPADWTPELVATHQLMDEIFPYVAHSLSRNMHRLIEAAYKLGHEDGSYTVDPW